MKIGISTSVIQRGKTGIAHYLFSLLAELRPFTDEHTFVLFVLEEDVSLFNFLEGSMEIVKVPEQYRKPVANIRWHQTKLPKLCAELNLDAIHVPSYRRLLFRAPCPKIGTIHDLAPFHVRGKYDIARMLYGRYVVKSLARRQDALITVSRTTARDVTRFFGVPEDEIDVVYNGLDHARFQPGLRDEDNTVLKDFNLDAPYFLYVARLEHPGKNHVRLIEAFDQYKAVTRSNHLLVLGGADWHGAEAIHQAAERSPHSADIRRVGYISDAQLPGLYRRATAMVYPSLFEGFGMPPVEAMACNCPVICSDRGSLAEIAAPAACIIDPENISQMADALRRISLEPNFANGLRKAGLQHAAKFNWKHAAAATLAVYERFKRSPSPRRNTSAVLHPA
ncbi:MAG TPA: glycosyltransferase family 1 protein [Verrucomicrobiae bacterium]|nr:glycosyltransferase family 1 protein [Verrucomicrobiae bacterium]